jgi:Flp pilus assembly protein TadG
VTVPAHKDSRREQFRAERGTALVELALVMPLLLVLILGMIDFGKAFNEWIDETHLANVGARLASVGYPVGGCTDANPNVCLAQYVQEGADLAELRSGRAGNSYAPAQTAARVCVSYPTNPATNTSGKVGDPVQVTIESTYRWLDYLTNRLDFNIAGTHMQGKATMRLERLISNTTMGCYPA